MLEACRPCKTMDGGQTIVDAGIFLAYSVRARWVWGLLRKLVGFYQVHELRLTKYGRGGWGGGIQREGGRDGEGVILIVQFKIIQD